MERCHFPSAGGSLTSTEPMVSRASSAALICPLEATVPELTLMGAVVVVGFVMFSDMSAA